MNPNEDKKNKQQTYKEQRAKKMEHAQDVFEQYVQGHGGAISGSVVIGFRAYLEQELKLSTRSVELYVTAVNEYLKAHGLETMCFKRKQQLDLKGRRFGSLIAVAPTDKRISGAVVWLCKCEACGKEVYVSSISLLSGKSQSCGCMRTKKMQEALGIDHGTNLALVFSDKPRVNNTSGCKGVSWSKARQLWVATITYKGKTKYLGGYKAKEDAVKARKVAEEKVRLDAEQYLHSI